MPNLSTTGSTDNAYSLVVRGTQQQANRHATAKNRKTPPQSQTRHGWILLRVPRIRRARRSARLIRAKPDENHRPFSAIVYGPLTDTLKRVKGQGQSSTKAGKPRGYFPDLRKARPRGWAESVVFICSFSTFGFALHMLVYLLCDERLVLLLQDATAPIVSASAWWGSHKSIGWAAFLSLIMGCWATGLSLSTWRKRPEQEIQATISRLGSLHLIAVLLTAWNFSYDNVYTMNIMLSTAGGWTSVQAWDGISSSIDNLWLPMTILLFSFILLGHRIPNYFRITGWYTQICLLVLGLCVINLVGFVYFCFMNSL